MVLLSSLAGKARETVYAPIDVSQRALDDNVAIFDREQFGDGGGAVRVLPFQGVFCQGHQCCLGLDGMLIAILPAGAPEAQHPGRDFQGVAGRN